MAYEYRATVLRVVDGDTLLLKVDLGFHAEITEKFRLAHIDCPEMGTPEGLEAKRFVDTFVGAECTLHCLGKDKYGRWLAEVEMGGEMLHDLIMRAGLAKPYEGGKRATH